MNFLERMGRDWALVAAAVVLGVSLIVGTVIVSRMVTYVKTFNTSLLSVNGTAQEQITSDEVKWTGDFSVHTDRSTLKTGYAQLNRDQSLVMAFLKQNGVAASQVTLSPISMTRSFMNCKFNPQACTKSALTAYTLSQTVVVQSYHVHRITALAQKTTTLINQGVVFTTQSLKYYYTKLPTLRNRLIAAAVTDAQHQAQRIVAATGTRLGPLVSVTTEPLQLTPVNSTQVSNMGSYDTSTIPKELTAMVRATFRLAG
ncbi:MAG: SIMPL domain-containing protein [Thermaerobacter sp.]|nr:SIMPL domain-containing protein [Thermaerobacter sp.]